MIKTWCETAIDIRYNSGRKLISILMHNTHYTYTI